MDNVSRILAHWRAEPSVGGNVVHWHQEPARPAAFQPLPQNIHPGIAAAFARMGYGQLYSHQAEAWDLLHADKNVAVVTGTASGKLILTVLGAIAEFERSLMLERQKEGIAKARAEGRYKGRAPTVRRQIEAIRALAAEGVSTGDIARRLKVHRTSVYRALLDDQPAAP